MKRESISLLLAVLLSCCLVQGAVAQAVTKSEISGEIVGGLRLLTIVPGEVNNFVIYRGDYIQPAFSGLQRFAIAIPELQIEKIFPVAEGEQAYIKMKKPGSYSFSAGAATGTIRVIEYSAASYTELNAEQAAQILRNTNPLILDVRTQGEFQQGYIQGANLLPVQALQQNMPQLAEYRDRDILIYCATGNRSTVAARLLIEAGFKKIYNLRYGISDWARRNYPVVR